jgi:hypothetical protein
MSDANTILANINEIATAYYVADLLIKKLGDSTPQTLINSKDALENFLADNKKKLAGQDKKIEIKEEQGVEAAKKIFNSLPPASIEYVTSVDWIGRMGKRDLPNYFNRTLGDTFNGNPSDFVIIFSNKVDTGLTDNNGNFVKKIWIGYSLKATFSKNGSIGAYNGSICKLIEGVISLTDNLVLDNECPPGGVRSTSPGSIVQRDIVGIWEKFLYAGHAEINWDPGERSQSKKDRQLLYKRADKREQNIFNKDKLQCFNNCREMIFQSFHPNNVPRGKFDGCEISDDGTQLKFTVSKDDALIPINAYLRINKGSEATYYKVEAYNKSKQSDPYRIEIYQPNPLLYLPANYLDDDLGDITFIVTKPTEKKDSVCTLNLCCPAVNNQQAAKMSIDFRIKAADTPPSGLKINGCDHKCKKTNNVYKMKTYSNNNAGALAPEEEKAAAAAAADATKINAINDYFIFVQEAILNYIEDQDDPLLALDRISNSANDLSKSNSRDNIRTVAATRRNRRRDNDSIKAMRNTYRRNTLKIGRDQDYIKKNKNARKALVDDKRQDFQHTNLLIKVLQDYVDLLHLPSHHTRGPRLTIRNIKKGNVEIIHEVIKNIPIDDYCCDDDDVGPEEEKGDPLYGANDDEMYPLDRDAEALDPVEFSLQDQYAESKSKGKAFGIKKHTRHKGKHHKKKNTRHKGKHHKGKHHKGTHRRNKNKK